MEIFTIGHSNLSLEDFIRLLNQHNITAIADVRSHPYSRRLPHFNKSALEIELKNAGIQYVFLGQELGARPPNPNCYVDGKAVYEKIASRPEFFQGIQRLLKGSETYKIALMCAEKDPITCHRVILICQHLREYPVEIYHILSDGTLETHQQIEERLLALHRLDDQTVNQPVQLSLFEMSHLSQDLKSRQERLKEAYCLQGNKIAYVEKSNDE